MRFQFGKIYLDNFVEVILRIGIYFRVGGEVLTHLVGEVGDLLAACAAKIFGHLLVISERRCCCADFGSHITNRSLSGARQRESAGTEVFDDRACSTLHCEDTRHLQNDILGRRPSVQPAC